VPKLRTMRHGAQQEYVALAHTNGLDGRGYVVDDPRVTRVGRVLRKYKLDEIPQLFTTLIYNVGIKRNVGLFGCRLRSPESIADYPADMQADLIKYAALVPLDRAGDLPRAEALEATRAYLRERKAHPRSANARVLARMIRHAAAGALRYVQGPDYLTPAQRTQQRRTAVGDTWFI
jgi:hypothetical protein